MGPMPTPSADTPAQMPMALARSRGFVNTLVMIERVAGMMNAAPMPMSERVKISVVAESAIADMSEPSPKTARPIARKRYRPNRSPRLPAVSSRPAKTRV